VADVRDPDAVPSSVAAVESKLRPISTVVNNAGTSLPTPAWPPWWPAAGAEVVARADQPVAAPPLPAQAGLTRHSTALPR